MVTDGRPPYLEHVGRYVAPTTLRAFGDAAADAGAEDVLQLTVDSRGILAMRAAITLASSLIGIGIGIGAIVAAGGLRWRSEAGTGSRF